MPDHIPWEGFCITLRPWYGSCSVHMSMWLFQAFTISIFVLSPFFVSACGESHGPSEASENATDSDLSQSATDQTGADGINAEVGNATSLCVTTINNFRATISLPPLVRWVEAESCAATEASNDAQASQSHANFGDCGEFAQNECPGWPGLPEAMIAPCLTMMWAEGPGDDYAQHGHYLNMTNSAYTKVACGFYTTSSGRVWAIQNFK